MSNDEILMGYWYKEEYSFDGIFSPFFKSNCWQLFVEGFIYWVNDDFDGQLPYFLSRNITEYRSDLLNDSKQQTEILLYITDTNETY